MNRFGRSPKTNQLSSSRGGFRGTPSRRFTGETVRQVMGWFKKRSRQKMSEMTNYILGLIWFNNVDYHEPTNYH